MKTFNRLQTVLSHGGIISFLANRFKRGTEPVQAHLNGLTPIQSQPSRLWCELHDEANLERAFEWLCQQTVAASEHSDVWDYRAQWETRKPILSQSLHSGEFHFQTVRVVEVKNEYGERECHEVRCAEDRLVIRALAQVLQPRLQPVLSQRCTHLQGNGGLKQAVQDTQAYLAEHPDAHVIKSDVKGYYAHIDHLLLADQLRHLLPNETRLHNLLWEFMRRTTEFGGNYEDVECGLPLGASLSPLLGAVYLSPLDALAKAWGGFYRRNMDDWVWVFDTKGNLRNAVKRQYAVLQALRVETHPDKTFIGRAKKGFDFLGFHCCPTGMQVSDEALSRRDRKIARPYEQGASKRRIGRYLVRWLGLACIGSVTFPCVAGSILVNCGVMVESSTSIYNSLCGIDSPRNAPTAQNNITDNIEMSAFGGFPILYDLGGNPPLDYSSIVYNIDASSDCTNGVPIESYPSSHVFESDLGLSRYCSKLVSDNGHVAWLQVDWSGGESNIRNAIASTNIWYVNYTTNQGDDLGLTCNYSTIEYTGSVSCTAGSVSGRQFTGWSGCSSVSENTCTVSNVTTPTTITANYSLIDYNVSATSGTGGTAGCSPTPVSYGESSTCTATASAGYTFSSWSGDCASQGATCSLANIHGNKSSTANFTTAVATQNGIATSANNVTANLSITGCSGFQGLPSFSNAPAGAQAHFPYGVLGFTATGCGSLATVSVTYSQPIPAGTQFYKCDDTSCSTYSATINGNTVTYTVSDNGHGDSNPADHIITDPSGNGFQDAAAIPTLSGWGKAILASLMGLVVVLTLRRRYL